MRRETRPNGEQVLRDAVNNFNSVLETTEDYLVQIAASHEVPHASRLAGDPLSPLTVDVT